MRSSRGYGAESVLAILRDCLVHAIKIQFKPSEFFLLVEEQSSLEITVAPKYRKSIVTIEECRNIRVALHMVVDCAR